MKSVEKIAVLIVEDDAIAQMSLTQMLREMGIYEVLATAEGEEALKLISENSFDLVFMDGFIKGSLSGVELTKKINDSTEIPVIYLTANSDPEVFKLIQKTRHYGILEKPYDYDVIERKITEVLEKIK